MERQSRSSSSQVLAFEYYPIEFAFRAIDQVIFPRYAGNTIRGALGTFLLQTATPEQYRSIFEPVATNGPSGFRNPPKPFVLRCGTLHRKFFLAGEEFRFGINLFDISRAAEVEAVLRAALERAKDEGLGVKRQRAELLASRLGSNLKTISLNPDHELEVRGLGLEFRTPTELSGYDPQEKLMFGLLFRRIRDRVSTLRSTYGEPFEEVDFRCLGERADLIEWAAQDLYLQPRSRKSSKTGRIHSIGGFIGNILFRGELTEFLPWLRIAEVTGVGRHTVWGNGDLAVTSS